jgi:pilus assembly protein CpaF
MIDLVAERSRFGGLERWLGDSTITDIVVNHGEVWVDRGAGLERVADMTADAAWAAIERILAPIGRRLDRTHPAVDARLPDGSRVCAVIPPLAVDGLCLAVRRFASTPLTLGAFGTPRQAALLAQLVDDRCNVVVSGATAAGKTSLLAALLARVAPTERLLTLEDVAELPVHHPHVVRLETRPRAPDGVDAVELDDLLRIALRLRPDRLVVGEVRGAEAAQLVQALNTGHDGSLATVHANSAPDALDRIATLVSSAAPSWPAAAIAHHVARAVDVVVHLARDAEGRRAVADIVEVLTPDGATPHTRSLLHPSPRTAPAHRRRR